MESIIRIQDVTFEYKRTGSETSAILALDGISLDIEKGSFTAIIGVNGSGKSTLAKNMNGLMLPTGGKVYVNGMDTADESGIWDVRQTIGMVFQNPDNQMVSAVVEDDIAFGPENLGVDPEEIRRRVDMSLQAVGMYDFRKKAPHMLSGGQKQRIAIAGVVAMLPECIVFDEPTAMLDPQGRREVLDIVEKLNKESGKTIVLITHFMDEVANADRIVVMDGGKIVMDGKPQEIFVRSDELKKLGLDVPFAAELACRLRQRGIDIPENIILMDELADHIKEHC
ncbi:MAG: energy-coupling factor transporter ATPase [Firmicutes bacterium]|nr:energy-coupling factor transporter ATPase [Clostridiales bacterium]MBQ4339561.1 energy-coupling factor transporter ATPase [Bacillota bacterium]